MMKNKQIIGDFLKRIKRPINLSLEKEYKLVTIKMNHNGVVLRGLKKGGDIKSNMYEVKQGDFILSGIDARNGAFGIVPAELDGAIVTNDFWYFDIDETIINKALFLELTSTAWFDDICKRGSDGTTQRIRLQKDKFFNQEIYLPLPDRQQELLIKIQSIKVQQVLLHQLSIEQQEQVKQLKQAILQEAIQGKLTKDWRIKNSDVEPASELLKRIKTEKQKLIDEKKIRKEKSLPPITDEEIPFALPDGWVWCRLGEILSLSSGDGLIAKNMQPGDIPVFGGNGINGYHNKHNTKEATLTIGRVGAYCGAIHLTPEHAWITDNCFRVYFDRGSIDETYFIWHLKYIDLGIASYNGSQPVISGKRVYPLLTHLPPLSEQKAIVKKIETLMQKFTILEAEIQQNKTHIEHLMQAVIKEAFEPDKNKEIS